MACLYQAKIGDGIKQKGLKRKDTFFMTPEEAVAEAFALKEKIDGRYSNEIQWDYDGNITGSTDNLKILKGYFRGDRKTSAFYLQILSIKKTNKLLAVSPIKANKLSKKDKMALKNAIQWFKPTT